MTSPSTHTHKAAGGTARNGALGASKMLETDRRRDNLSGKLHGRDWKSGGGEEPAYPDEQREKPEDSSQRTDARSRGSSGWTYSDKVRRRYELRGFRTAGVVDGKSQFNKEKYLPLARDVPVLISHYCCMEMKKKPMKKYQHKNKLYPLLGTLADESRTRKQAWIRHGCNAFESKSPTSQPLSFWTEQDILTYIAKYQVEIASVYGEIIAVDENGNEYPARELIVPACKLKCEKCDRTGQINAAR